MVFGTPPLPEKIVGVALVVTGAVFAEVGRFMRGDVEGKDAGQVAFLAGSMTLLAGIVNAFVIQKPMWSTLAFVFGITQVSAGYHMYNELPWKGVGYLSVLWTAACWWWGIWQCRLGQWIYALLGFEWGWIFASFIPFCIYGKYRRLAMVTVFFSEWVTLFAPGMIILTGHSLLM